MYWIISLMGVLLLVAPFVLGFTDNNAALWTCFSLGLVVALSASTKAVTGDEGEWEVGTAAIAGFLAILAPDILGFSANGVAAWTCAFLGLAVGVLAGSDYFGHPTGHTRALRMTMNRERNLEHRS